jgi:acetylornithine deacetylase
MLKVLQELIKRNSENPPCDCRTIVKYVSGYLKKHTRARVMVQRITGTKSNVIAQFGKPEILLNAHLDTVPAAESWTYDPFFMKRTKNRVYGLGATDVKGPVAAILAAVREQPPENLMLFFCCDEEAGGSECVRGFLKSKYAKGIHYATVTEPTQGNIVTLHKGIYIFEVTIHGESAHASHPERGLNAIEQAADFIKSLDKLKKRVNKRTYKKLAKPTFNVGMITGGTKANLVPDICRIEIDRRFLPGKDSMMALKELKALVRNQTKKAEVKKIFAEPAFKSKHAAPVIKLLTKAGAKQKFSAVNFWTEAALFQKARIASIVFGPGNIAQAHSANEFAKISDLKQAKKIYQEFFSHV